MTRTKDDHEIENRKRRRIARDGETVSVPIFMLDSLQRSVAGVSLLGDVGVDWQGPLILGDTDAEARQAAYNERIGNAWKGPQTLPTAPVDEVPKSPSFGDGKAIAYARYEDRLANAWRHA